MTTPIVPIIITQCLSGMDYNFVSCQNQGIYAEDILYPAFKLAPPEFVSQNQRQLWTQKVREFLEERAIADADLWMNYFFQYGQNVIYSNVIYNGNPPTGWSASACMNSQNRANFPKVENWDQCGIIYETLVIGHTPDSSSFQHVMDRTLNLLIQNAHLRNSSDVMTIEHYPNRFISQILKSFGVEQTHSNLGLKICARKLIYSCRTPLIHPKFALGFSEVFDLPHVEITQKRTIVYLQRSHGTRQIINDRELIESLEKIDGYELVVKSSWSNVDEVHQLMGNQSCRHCWSSWWKFLQLLVGST